MFSRVYIGALPDASLLAEFAEYKKIQDEMPIDWTDDADLKIHLISEMEIADQELADIGQTLKQLAKPLDGFRLTFNHAEAGPDPYQPEYLFATAKQPPMLGIISKFMSDNYGFDKQPEEKAASLNIGRIVNRSNLPSIISLNLTTAVSELILYVLSPIDHKYQIVDRIQIGKMSQVP